jgi:GNAT superfamily N-acetyltransferase
MAGALEHPGLILRDAHADELAAIAELLLASYAQYETAFPPPVWETYRQEIAAVRSRSSSGELVVAALDAEPMGTVTFYPSAALDGHAWPAGVASFRLLAVHPSARRLGVGRLLVQECVRRARRCGASFLGLHTAFFMVAAVRIYEAMGFVRTPEHDFEACVYYGGAEPDEPPAGDPIPGLAYLLRLPEG